MFECVPSLQILAVVLVLILKLICVETKVATGVLSSFQARKSSGQFLGTFCVQGGDGLLTYNINATGPETALLYIVESQTWQQSKWTLCNDQQTAIVHRVAMTNMSGNFTMHSSRSCSCWHIMYADEYTCDQDKELTQPIFLLFYLQLVNMDMIGSFTQQFSAEEKGILGFYELLLLLYFVLGCIHGPTMYHSLHTEGPMQLVIRLLCVVSALQAGAITIITTHLGSYSKNGYGIPVFEVFSEFLDLCSQFVMLYMMLSLCLGRSSVGVYKPLKNFSRLTEQVATHLVSALGVCQCVLFLWEQYEERTSKLFHRSLIGVLLSAVRTLLAVLISSHLFYHISTERSNMKKEFYSSFTKCCLLWFLCYPTVLAMSLTFSQCLQYRAQVIGVMTCQSITIVCLFRLFLSRSSYWEVSALSSTLLPLKMDKLAIKLRS